MLTAGIPLEEELLENGFIIAAIDGHSEILEILLTNPVSAELIGRALVQAAIDSNLKNLKSVKVLLGAPQCSSRDFVETWIPQALLKARKFRIQETINTLNAHRTKVLHPWYFALKTRVSQLFDNLKYYDG